MMAPSSTLKLAPASSHICQIMQKPKTAPSAAMVKPAAVFFGMGMEMNPPVGRTWPLRFMSHQASISCTTGVNAKL